MFFVWDAFRMTLRYCDECNWHMYSTVYRIGGGGGGCHGNNQSGIFFALFLYQSSTSNLTPTPTTTLIQAKRTPNQRARTTFSSTLLYLPSNCAYHNGPNAPRRPLNKHPSGAARARRAESRRPQVRAGKHVFVVGVPSAGAAGEAGERGEVC